MKYYSLFKFSGLVLGCLVIAACAAPPISEQYREEAQTEDMTWARVYPDPNAYIGKIVLWGGSIIQTTNTKSGTEIIVLHEPLGGGERPRGTTHAYGRFIAMSPKFLDPAIYKEGRQITLAGKVAGQKILPLGKTSYAYPVITIEQIHLWKKPGRYYYPYDYYYYYPPPGGFYGDFYGGEEEEEEEEEEQGMVIPDDMMVMPNDMMVKG